MPTPASVRHPIYRRRPPPHPSPLSSTTSIATVLHHAGVPTKTASSTARDGHFSSTATDQEPCIASSRFIGAVVLFAGAAHTTFSSTATGLIPRCTRLPSQICFNATEIAPPMPTRRRKRGRTSYLLNFLISTRNKILTWLLYFLFSS